MYRVPQKSWLQALLCLACLASYAAAEDVCAEAVVYETPVVYPVYISEVITANTVLTIGKNGYITITNAPITIITTTSGTSTATVTTTTTTTTTVTGTPSSTVSPFQLFVSGSGTTLDGLPVVEAAPSAIAVGSALTPTTFSIDMLQHLIDLAGNYIFPVLQVLTRRSDAKEKRQTGSIYALEFGPTLPTDDTDTILLNNGVVGMSISGTSQGFFICNDTAQPLPVFVGSPEPGCVSINLVTKAVPVTSTSGSASGSGSATTTGSSSSASGGGSSGSASGSSGSMTGSNTSPSGSVTTGSSSTTNGGSSETTTTSGSQTGSVTTTNSGSSGSQSGTSTSESSTSSGGSTTSDTTSGSTSTSGSSTSTSSSTSVDLVAEATSIIESQSLQDFCTALLDYTQPLTTDTVTTTGTTTITPAPVTSTVTTTTGSLVFVVSVTTTTVTHIDLAFVTSTSYIFPLPGATTATNSVSTPTALTTFADSILSSACSYEATPITSTFTLTSTTVITDTSTLPTSTSYVTTTETIDTTILLTSTSTSTTTQTYTLTSTVDEVPCQTALSYQTVSYNNQVSQDYIRGIFFGRTCCLICYFGYDNCVASSHTSYTTTCYVEIESAQSSNVSPVTYDQCPLGLAGSTFSDDADSWNYAAPGPCA